MVLRVVFFFIKLAFRWLPTGLSDLKNTKQLKFCLLVGNPNRKKMYIFGFVGIFEYIC